MNNELIERLKQIIIKTKEYHISLDYTNDILKKYFIDAWMYYGDLLQEKMGIPYPFLIDYSNPSFIIKDNELFLRLIDSDKILEYAYKITNNTPFIDKKKLFDDVRKIKNVSELKENFPEIYNMYIDLVDNYKIKEKRMNRAIINNLDTLDKNGIVIKTFRYAQNIQFFINDLCDYFELLITNKEQVDEIINNNLYSVSFINEEEYYNLLFVILVNIINSKNMLLDINNIINNSETPKTNGVRVEIRNNVNDIIMDIINELEESKKELVISKENDDISLKMIKEQFKIEENDIKKEKLPGWKVDYVAFSHGKEYTFPILDSQYLFSGILVKNKFFGNIYEYHLLKYSGLFECAYNKSDTGEFVLGLKNEYNRYSIEDLALIAIRNMQFLKEKQVEALQGKVSEADVVKFLKDVNNKEQIEKYLINILKFDFKTKLEDIENYLDYNNLLNSQLYYTVTKDINNIDNLDNYELMMHYIFLIDSLDSDKSLFIKFADKSYLKEEDFINLKNKIEKEVIIRLGKEKIEEILEQTKNTNSFEEISDIIKNSLIKKKNINDEIRDIEKIKSKTLESDPQYRILNQRLNKLLLYKNHFDTELVISGEGKIFENYYGFEFDGIYVFDYFVDTSNENVLSKAKNEFGNRIFILTYEDYLKVKDLNSKTEVRNYINGFLRPCADYMNHNDNVETRLLKKLDIIKTCINKRKFILNMAKSDSPVTEEEILMTQEEFDYYVSRFVSSEEEVLRKMRQKKMRYDSKEILEREKNIKIVEDRKNQYQLNSDLKESEKEEFEDEITKTEEILENINQERKQTGLKALSFEEDNYYDVYKAIIDYEEKHNISRTRSRDPQVALNTKIRTKDENGYYHCESCGLIDHDLSHFDSHHFIPISDGGPDDIYNTVCLCPFCHRDIHKGKFTDMQNYKLIKTIRDNIISRTPEVLSKFEKTLGFKENSYLEQIDNIENEILKVQQNMEDVLDKEGSNDEILKEFEGLLSYSDSLQERKQKLLLLANRIQDYYCYSGYQKTTWDTEENINKII